MKRELEETVVITTKELVEKYGKPVSISLESAIVAVEKGYNDHLFCTMSSDGDSFGGDRGEPGMHIVNVVERYFFPKELPPNILVENIDYFCLGD